MTTLRRIALRCPDCDAKAQASDEPVPTLSSASPALDLPRPAWRRGRVSHVAYMRVQAALMPRGAELAWIEQHSAAFRAWVERFARVSDEGPPTISEATLRGLAQENFVVR
jgi:hypothetical protein